MRLIVFVIYRQYFKSSEDKNFMSMPKRVFLFDHELSIWFHARGVSADPTKVQAMLVALAEVSPSSSFSITSYYRGFVANYSQIVWPLNQ